ncbi:MAG TPA: hypothetical protein VFK50_11985 [Sphingomicrobium sp.]|nr:hypothetical protein [Sphingomicrobium sp.]
MSCSTREHCEALRVGQISLGAVGNLRDADHISPGIGGLLAVNFIVDQQVALHGGPNPA